MHSTFLKDHAQFHSAFQIRILVRVFFWGVGFEREREKEKKKSFPRSAE
jgi:hypothetical protein